jgi:hypothetical protein
MTTLISLTIILLIVVVTKAHTNGDHEERIRRLEMQKEPQQRGSLQSKKGAKNR